MDSQSLNFDQAEKLAAEWTKVQPIVATFVFSLVKDFNAMDEILSRVAVTLVRKYGSYDTKQPFLNWSMGIAKYEVLKLKQFQARDRHQFDGDLIEDMCSLCDEVADEINPRMLYLEKCLKQVQGRARLALTLRYVG